MILSGSILAYDELEYLTKKKGKKYAYKYVTSRLRSPVFGGFREGIVYKIGKTISVKDYDSDPLRSCGSGINLATKKWCEREMRKDIHILIKVSFKTKDVVCIPFKTDGKFRVKQCKVEKIVRIGEDD